MRQISLFWHFIGTFFTCFFVKELRFDLRFHLERLGIWRKWGFEIWLNNLNPFLERFEISVKRFDLRFAHHWCTATKIEILVLKWVTKVANLCRPSRKWLAKGNTEAHTQTDSPGSSPRSGAESDIYAVPSLPALGPWAPPSRTGPLARKYLPGFPYSWSLRRLRQKISSIYCTVICNYPSAAQEQPFTVGLFFIIKTVKLNWPDMHC